MHIGVGIGIPGPAGGAAAAWVPTDESGLLYLFDSAEGIALSGSDVSNWADQSGNGHHLANATGNTPTYTASGGLNNEPYLGFDPADYQSLPSAAAVVNASTDHTFFAVYGLLDAADDRQFLLSTAGGNLSAMVVGSTLYVGVFDGAYRNGTIAAAAEGQYVTWSMDSTANTCDISKNGGAVDTVAYAIDQSHSGTLYVGRFAGGAQFYCKLKLYLLGCYSKVLGAAPLASLQGYMATRYGL